MKNCVIWYSAPTSVKRKHASIIFDSPRAGGAYEITDSAEGMLGGLTSKEKKSITRWLVAQRSRGNEIPQINSSNIEALKSTLPLSFTHKVNAALLFIGRNIVRLDQGLELREGAPLTLRLIAETDSDDFRDLQALLGTMNSMGLLGATIGYHQNVQNIPSPAGWMRFEQLTEKVSTGSQAFVAMWFDDSMRVAFSDGISPAIEKAGYRPMRIDQKEHVNKVDDEIIAEIRRSRFLVSDFSCEPEKPRGGVYFEAGFAMGLGIPVIWTCRRSSMGDLHFDTRQYSHIVWDAPQDLHDQLLARIGAVIGDGPFRKPA